MPGAQSQLTVKNTGKPKGLLTLSIQRVDVHQTSLI